MFGKLKLWWRARTPSVVNTDARMAPVDSLGRLDDPHAFERQAGILEENGKGLHQAAETAPGEIGETRAVVLLLTQLVDPEVSIRVAAAKALRGLGESKWETHVRGDDEDFLRLAKSEDPRAVEMLTGALRSPDFHVADKAAMALAAIGAITPLTNALSDRHAIRGIAEAFSEYPDKRAVEALCFVLKEDTKDWYTVKIAKALGRIGDTRAVDSLLAALDRNRKEDFALEAVVEALGAFRCERAIQPLIDMLKRCKGVLLRPTIAAVRVLAKFQDPRAFEPILEVLGSSIAREEAASALVELADPRTFDALAVMLKSETWYCREGAVTALGLLGDRRGVDLLIKVMEDDDGGLVRQEAARALGRLGDRRAVEPLTRALNAEHWQFRYAVIDALAALADPLAAESLRNRLHAVTDKIESEKIEGALSACGR